MLKQEITYTDFDDTVKTRTFWFHMTEIEIAKALISEDGGLENRWRNALATEDKSRFILVFDELVRLSIGKRDDELGFTKPKGYSDAFMASEAYSQMWKDISSDVKLAIAFFNGIFPKGALDRAKTDLLARQGEPGVPKVSVEEIDLLGLSDKQPANEKKPTKPGHEYSVEELKAMTDDEFKEWERRTPAQIMRQDQIQYAYVRKTSQR